MTTMNININFENNTIELTKEDAKKASKYGTPEYKELMEARKDFPEFAVVTVKENKRRNRSEGKYDYKFMEKVIKESGTKELADEYRSLRGIDEFGDRMEGASPADYAKVNEWFKQSFPEIENNRKAMQNKQSEIIASIESKKAEMKKREKENKVVMFKFAEAN